MLTICEYCKKRIHPARKELHLKKCLQYRRLLRLNKIKLKTEDIEEVVDTVKKKKKKQDKGD